MSQAAASPVGKNLSPTNQGDAKTRKLSEEEFRALAVRQLRNQHFSSYLSPRTEPTQSVAEKTTLPSAASPPRAAQPIPTVPAAVAVPPARPRRQLWPVIKSLAVTILQVVFFSFVFCGSKLNVFLWLAGVSLFLKLLVFLCSKVHVKVAQPPPVDTTVARPFSNARVLWYVVTKCAVTFVLSMFPSFRVENLERELKNDGVLPRFRAPQPQPEPQGQPGPQPPDVRPAAE